MWALKNISKYLLFLVLVLQLWSCKVGKKEKQNGKTVLKSVAQGDFAFDQRDPKKVCEELQKEQKMEKCKLLSAKSSQDEKECVEGKSIAGCFACKFHCEE